MRKPTHAYSKLTLIPGGKKVKENYVLQREEVTNKQNPYPHQHIIDFQAQI